MDIKKEKKYNFMRDVLKMIQKIIYEIELEQIFKKEIKRIRHLYPRNFKEIQNRYFYKIKDVLKNSAKKTKIKNILKKRGIKTIDTNTIETIANKFASGISFDLMAELEKFQEKNKNTE